MTNEKEVNMKPCPFCGGEACFIGDTRCIMCKKCGCRLIINSPLISTQDAAKIWNKRVNEKALEIVESMLADGLITAHIENREFWETVKKALGGSAEETQCSAYHLVKQRRYLSEYEKGYRAAKGLPSLDYEDIEVGTCWGTKECETCECGGDENKCDFYPRKRQGVKK